MLGCSIAIREASMELSSALPAKQLHAVCKIGQPAVPTLADRSDTGQNRHTPGALLSSMTAVSSAQSLTAEIETVAREICGECQRLPSGKEGGWGQNGSLSLACAYKGCLEWDAAFRCRLLHGPRDLRQLPASERRTLTAWQ